MAEPIAQYRLEQQPLGEDLPDLDDRVYEGVEKDLDEIIPSEGRKGDEPKQKV